MPRFFRFIFLGVLVIGLMGPMSAYAWRMVACTDSSEEEHQESSSETAKTFLRSTNQRVASRFVPFLRSGSVRRVWHRRVERVVPPAQVVSPRVVMVWLPSLLGVDDDPLC